jgi:sodium/proline symporter
MLAGGISVFVWKLVLNEFLSAKISVFGLYELLPAFIISSVAIVVGSLLSKEPEKAITDDFERARIGDVEDAI